MKKLALLLMMIYAASIPLENAPLLSGLGTVSRLAGILAAGGWACFVLMSSRGRIRFSAAAGWFLAFCVWGLASFLWAESQQYVQLASLVQLVTMLFISVDLLRSEGDLRSVLVAYTVGTLLAASLAVFASPGASASTDRLVLFEAIGPAHFAASLIPGIVCLLHYGLGRVSLVRSLLSVGGVILLAYAMLASGTRSAVVGLGAALVVLAILDKRIRPIAVVTFAVVVSALLVSPQLRTRFIDEGITYGGSGRLAIWGVGVTLVGEHPLVGGGLFNFPTLFRDEAIRATGPLIYDAVLRPGLDAHNIYLEMAVEVGAIGLLMFLVPIWRTIAVLRKGFLREQHLALALMAAYLAEGFFLPILNRKYFWLVLGLGLVAAHLKSEQIPDTESATQSARLVETEG